MTLPPLIFISYCHADKSCKEELYSQLKSLEMNGELRVWDDQHVRTGETWNTEIEQVIGEAHVAVLIITSSYLNSEFISKTEVPLMLERHAFEHLKLFPIIAKPCTWKRIDWLYKLQVWRTENGAAVWTLPPHQLTEALSYLAGEISDRARMMTGPTERKTPADQPQQAGPEIDSDDKSTPDPKAPTPETGRRRPAFGSQSTAMPKRSRWLTPRKMVVYILALLVTLISLWSFMFTLAHADYNRAPVQLGDLSVDTVSKRYLSPGDDEIIRFKINNESEKKQHLATISLEAAEHRIILDKTNSIYNDWLQALNTTGMLEKKVRFKTSSANFWAPKPAHLGLVGQVDKVPFQRQELLLYIAPVPKVATIERYVFILTGIMCLIFFARLCSWTFTRLN